MDKKALDAEMIRLQRGDEDAFEVIYRETHRGLFAFILSICKNYHTAEDVMQLTYIRVRKAVSIYRPGSNAPAWIYTIAKNLTVNELNRHKREISSDMTEDEGYGHYLIDESEIDQPVISAMHRCLSEKESQMISLHLFAGFKHREIADMLEMPLGTVLWAYRNALNKLKKTLIAEGICEDET